MRHVKIGDVFRAPSGLLRIVRHVKRSRNPRRYWVVFTIQRCSWTHRAVTIYSLGELRQIGYVHTRQNVKLASKFDKLIEYDCTFPTTGKDRGHFDCCDVRGIP